MKDHAHTVNITAGESLLLQHRLRRNTSQSTARTRMMFLSLRGEKCSPHSQGMLSHSFSVFWRVQTLLCCGLWAVPLRGDTDNDLISIIIILILIITTTSACTSKSLMVSWFADGVVVHLPDFRAGERRGFSSHSVTVSVNGCLYQCALVINRRPVQGVACERQLGKASVTHDLEWEKWYKKKNYGSLDGKKTKQN